MSTSESTWRRVSFSAQNTQEGRHFVGNQIVTSKFSLLTFLPKALLEQFRKYSNYFFALMIVIQLVIPVPTNPFVYIFTFSTILCVSLVKAGFEDWLRHKADDSVNSRPVHVFDHNFNLLRRKAEAIRVGEVIRLEENEAVPCDVLLIASVSTKGHILPTCEVTTANLDGEPNRKVRTCVLNSSVGEAFKAVEFFEALARESLVVECDEPNADLHKFNGLLSSAKTSEKGVPLGMENVLLRGTTVKNSHFVCGLALYTGSDTRLSLNSSQARANKFSVVDAATNKVIITMAIVLLLFISAAMGAFWRLGFSAGLAGPWYLPEAEESVAGLYASTGLLFLVLFSNVIPISLTVSVEIQKFMSKYFFEWDEGMRCGRTGNAPLCNNSDVIDDLGQIDYLLTDKTGTLTQNNLNFVCCSFGGRKYEYQRVRNVHKLMECRSPATRSSALIESPPTDAGRLDFLEAISLCQTVQAIRGNEEPNNSSVPQPQPEIQYHGASSDEEVLVEAAHTLGITYLGDDIKGRLLIDKNGEQQVFTRHLVFEFDAERKCMSVIVEGADKRVFIITKGAESEILPKCRSTSSPEILQVAWEHVNDFAKKGHRTLAVGKRELSSAELTSIQSEFDRLRRHPAELGKLYSRIESIGLEFVGVTGVEDQLQENVAQTLSCLREAGIRIWMLTGDKLETAVNIGMTCGLIHSAEPEHPYGNDTNENHAHISHSIVSLSNISSLQHLTERLQGLMNNLTETKKLSALVIDGVTFALGYAECPELLGRVVVAPSQLIFCRMAPIQKAQVVRLIKSVSTQVTVRICAVGDGGNDVAMIQEGNVGIGILGREGLQAARAADFAIPEFQTLQKAILVHGCWNYKRLVVLVQYFFYRAFLLSLPQFVYGIENGFSGEPIFDSTFMMFFALLFSSIPVLIYGVTERPHSVEELLRSPRLYGEYKGNALMGWRCTAWLGVLVIWHAVVVLLSPRLLWSDQGHDLDWALYSHLFNALVLCVTDLKLVMVTFTFTWITLFGQVVSFGLMLLYYLLSTEVFGAVVGGRLQFVYYRVLSLPDFWYVSILVSVMAVLPDLILGGQRRLAYLRGRRSAMMDKSSRL